MKLNLILSLMALSILSSCSSAKKMYKKDVRERLEKQEIETRKITNTDLEDLPEPVAKYLDYCGWIGKDIPRNFFFRFDGRFSLKPGKEMKVTSEQYNWLKQTPVRLFYMRNPIISGYHCYNEKGASMLIKLFGRIKVAYTDGAEMDQAELVTFLNDMCIFAPGALVDAPISWETIDPHTVNATMSQYGNTVSATLYFNEKNELVNFISRDRYATTSNGESENVPWSTPVKDYEEINGIKLPSYGEAIWHYPDHDFSYAKLNIKEVKWNVHE
ncbi:MAG: hypothetical protein PF436_14610 [Prolixibacteraceae bacterium]|jgi:hypothetical protein|nr:hypothetical protein [Prolixibacteraceae bacterium]